MSSQNQEGHPSSPDFLQCASHAKIVNAIIALERFQLEVGQASTRQETLELLVVYLNEVLESRISGVLTPEGQAMKFGLATRIAPENAARLCRATDHAIDQGMFGWAVHRTRPVLIQIPDEELHLVLAALRTRQRILGMFAALVQSAPPAIGRITSTVTTSLLACAANSIQNEELTRPLQ